MTDIIETNGGVRCVMCGVVNWPTAMACMGCNASLSAQFRDNPYSRREKSFSQSIARFFEITDYVLLVPATVGLLYSLMLFPVLPLIIGVWYALGCLLLRGFYRHSRNRLSNSGAITLWCATFVYNLIDLLILTASNGRANVLYAWPIIVMLLSLAALVSDVQEKKAAVN